MNTTEKLNKLNNTLGYLTAMSFDRPELSDDLSIPIENLNELIADIEN